MQTAHPRYEGVFILALAVRGLWLSIVLSAHSPTALATLFPDSYRYHALAQYLLGMGFPLPMDVPVMPSDPAYHSATGALLFSGPGYPMAVASVYAIAGVRPLAMLIVQIVLSAATCRLIARVAHHLTGMRNVAIGAGVLAALSMTSVVLSVALLTETCALYCTMACIDSVVRMRQTDRLWRLPTAGVFAALAVMLKPALQPLVLAGVLGVIGWLVQSHWHQRQERDNASRRPNSVAPRTVITLLALAIPVLTIFHLCLTNYARHGVFVLAANGPHSLHYGWTARAVAQATNGDIAGAQRAMGDALRERMRAGQISSYSALQREDLAAFRRAWSIMPAAMITAYARSVWDNGIAPDDLHRAQAPQWELVWRVVDPVWRHVIGPAMPILLLAGVAVLWRRVPRGALVLLLAWYGLTAAVSGVAYWQGSRYLFPASPAMWIVISWAACHLAGRRQVVGRHGIPE